MKTLTVAGGRKEERCLLELPRVARVHLSEALGHSLLRVGQGRPARSTILPERVQ